MIRKFLSALFVTALLSAGCAGVDEPRQGAAEEGVAAQVATKVINSAVKADEHTLLLVVNADAARDIQAGITDERMSAVCEQTGVVRMERLFVSNTDYARSRGLDRWYLVTFADRVDPSEVAAMFAELEVVEKVQYNTIVEREFGNLGSAYKFTPKGYGDFNLPFNDPLLPDQWHYVNNVDLSVAETSRAGADVNVRDAWRLCAGDPAIIVAVCDEGVKYSHPDLKDNMWVNQAEMNGQTGVDDDGNGYVDDIHGFNFLSTPEFPKDITWNGKGDRGHGTHVAGTVAAVNNNGIGVGGVAGGSGNGDGVRIMSCQVFEGNSSATVAARAKAYEYAANNGACVLQCSFGVPGGMVTSDAQFEDAYGVEKVGLDYFINYRQAVSPVDKNIVVFASGNDGYHLAGYPAAHRDYICVSAFGPDYLPAQYTNYGPGSNIAAPGGDSAINMTVESDRAMILSTVPSDCEAYDADYGYMEGTSMACPHVSGVVALGLSYARQLGKSFTYDEFMSMLYTSVNNIDRYIETCTKKVNGVNMDLTPYWQEMGTGAIDTWRLFMQIEGIPSLIAEVGEETELDIEEYFGGAAENLTFVGIEVSDEAAESLGIEGAPFIRNGKLFITCTKVGSAKIAVTAIAGGDVTATGSVMGGTEFTRDISILAREYAVAENGGWL